MRRCPLCDDAAEPSGSRNSPAAGHRFDYGVCPSCGLGLVLNPSEDCAALYDRAYYEGRRSDHTVDYFREIEEPGIRALEWQGLTESLGPVDSERRVLDFGAGLGGLVVTLRDAGWQAWGFEGEGYAHDYMREHDIPCLDELPTVPTFDTVFAIEVVEHLVDPLPVLRSIRAAMVPGGRLIITTGNFARARASLDSWTYSSVPDVHVTFWTPSSWAKALHLAGFEVDELHAPLSPAVTQYKVLKAVPRPLHGLAGVAPAWRPIAGRVDRLFGVSEFADGVAPPEDTTWPGDYLSRIAPPADLSEIPPYDRGWQTPEGALSHLTYVGGAGWSWSNDLEELHEESSRDHFIDVLTRDCLIGALPNEPAVIADLGCSTGYLLEDLRRRRPTAQLIGVDVVAAGLVKAHEAVPEAALLLADVCDLPLPDDSLDAAVSANMLEHVEDDVAALREVHRFLRPGGTAAFVVPFGARLLDYYDDFLGHHRRYGRNELADKARGVGLDVVRVDHLGQFLYPPFWLVKKRNRLLRGRLEGDALGQQVQHDIDATSNSRLGELACSWERSMVRRGISTGVGIRELRGRAQAGPGRLAVNELAPVCILAGGRATRLGDVVAETPKPLLAVAGRPFIFHQLDLLRRSGAREVVICTGYLGTQFQDIVGDGSRFDLIVRYSDDGQTAIGTAGAVRRALPLLGERFLVLYGDTYLRIDYSAVDRAARDRQLPALMTVLRNEGQWDTSNAMFDGDRVVRYDKVHPDPDMQFIDYGLSVLTADALHTEPDASDLSTVFHHLAKAGELAGFEATQRFYEIGTPAALRETDQFLSEP